MSTAQGWVANSTPGIYRWHLPVFTGLENTPQVANTGKYWQIKFFFALKYSRNLKQDGLKHYNRTKWVKNVKLIFVKDYHPIE